MHEGHAHHDHDHPHAHAPSSPDEAVGEGRALASGTFSAREAAQAKRLALILGIFAAFFGVEMAGAIAARSVVLQADALHLLMDLFSLAMSLVAMRVAVRRPTPRFTFGMRRAEPVAAVLNAMLVLAATVEIVREAVGELHGGEAPHAGIMLVVAAGALVVNGTSAWLIHGALHPDHAADTHDAGHDRHDGRHAHPHHAHGAHGTHGGHAMNLRGAWLHLLGDVLASLAALVAALVIRLGGPAVVDPLATFAVAAILVWGALRLLRDATLVLLEASPAHLPVATVRARILAFPGVRELHELHVWTLGAGHDAITAHVIAADPQIAPALSSALRVAFATEYVTVQAEVRGDDCEAGRAPSS